MRLPDQYIISDFLKHRVRCDLGIDHGQGVIAWMHPPAHRLLGWISKPSSIQLSRHVWRLNQVKGIAMDQVFVKGKPENYDQSTLQRLPTLLNAGVVNKKGEKIATMADFIFQFNTGKIINYLISRSDPRLPGTSRWRLTVDHIIDQQPGIVFLDIDSIDELPLAKSSIKQDFLKKSRELRDQLQGFTDIAGTRLEGWLEDIPWDASDRSTKYDGESYESDPLEDWNYRDSSSNHEDIETSEEFDQFPSKYDRIENQDDPWI